MKKHYDYRNKLLSEFSRILMRSGMSGKELAEKTKLPKSTISRVRNQQVIPSIQTLTIISRTLGYEPILVQMDIKIKRCLFCNKEFTPRAG